MAKGDTAFELEDEKKGLGSKLLTIIITLIIILVWIGIFGVLIKLDVGRFGSTILRPLIKDIPVVNKVLPRISEEELAYENDYPYKSLKEAVERIKELEADNEKLRAKEGSENDEIEELKKEVARLKEFEENQLAFEERVKEFDEQVVYAEAAPSIEEYRKFYEQINPRTAEEIYRQVIEQIRYSEAVKEKGDIYRKMKPQEAAAILEKMTAADINLVAEMLLTMRPAESSAILAKMDSNQAAKVTKKMFDMDEERLLKSRE